MNKPTEISLLTRLGAKAMRAMVRVTQGYDPIFLEQMLDMLGPRELSTWGNEMSEVIDALEEALGAGSSQHVIGFAALLNGCPFCSIGHIFAGNLEVFRVSGVLFPIDEREVPQLQGLRDDALLLALRDRLSKDFAETLGLIVSLYELKTELRAPRTRLDSLMLRIAAAWDLLAECTVLCQATNPSTVDPLTPIAKDSALRQRYDAARGRG